MKHVPSHHFKPGPTLRFVCGTCGFLLSHRSHIARSVCIRCKTRDCEPENDFCATCIKDREELARKPIVSPMP